MNARAARRGPAGNSELFLGTLAGAIAIGLVLSLVGPVHAGTPGTAGDTTADRELGQIDFTHNMFDFGGAAALSGLSGVAVDSAGHLYVSDSINNRILGWTSAGAFANGDPAHLVIGQPDFYSYRCDDGTAAGDAVADMVFGQDGSFTTALCNGSDSDLVAGLGIVIDASVLCSPAAVALDPSGNLYAADSDNSRMLVFDTPLNPSSGESGAGDSIADRELGQTDLGHNMEDFGGAQALELANPSSTNVTAANPAIDANGHLYVPGTVNSRVLGWTSASAFSNGAPAALVSRPARLLQLRLQ